MTDSADKLRTLYMTTYIERSNEQDGVQIGRAPSIIDNNNTIHSTSSNLRTCQGLPQAFPPFPNLNDKHFNAWSSVTYCVLVQYCDNPINYIAKLQAVINSARTTIFNLVEIN